MNRALLEKLLRERWHSGCRACMLITAVVILATILIVQYGFGAFPR